MLKLSKVNFVIKFIEYKKDKDDIHKTKQMS